MREWLRAARERKGLSQHQVAQSIGISDPSYNNIERGKFAPKPMNAIAIGKLLEVDPMLFYEAGSEDREDDADS